MPKRVAPYLVNGIAALGALAETAFHAGTGDAKTAGDSLYAFGMNSAALFFSIAPHRNCKCKNKDNSINGTSAFLNGAFGTIAQLQLEFGEGYYGLYHSRSISARALPIVGILGVGLNALEYVANKDEK